MPDGSGNRVADGQSLWNQGFIALSVLFLFASSAMAAFFHIHGYLASLGIPASWAGFIIGADSLAGFVIQPFCAPYLTRRNAAPWMAAGLCVLGAALVCYSAARGVGGLIAVRIAQGAGFVLFMAAMMAAVVGFIPKNRSGQAFGVLSLVRLVPYAIVPPLTAFFLNRSVSFPGMAAWLAVAVGVCLPVLLLVKRPAVHGAGANQPEAIGFHGVKGILKDPVLQGLLAANLMVFIGYTIVFFYITGFGREMRIGHTELFFTIAISIMAAVRLLGSTFFDRFSKCRLIAWCLALLVACFPLLIVSRGWAFLCVAGLLGLAWGVAMPLLNAVVFDVSPAHLQGVNMNMTLIMMQGGFLLGPVIGGLILHIAGYPMLFVVCSAVTFLALIIMMKTERRMRHGQPERNVQSIG